MITFETLKERLLKDGYVDSPKTDETAKRLLSLTGKPLTMLEEWIELGIKPHFSAIEGVDYSFLQQRLSMKDAALIIAYSMLLDNPKDNASYFKHLADNIIGFYPTSINN